VPLTETEQESSVVAASDPQDEHDLPVEQPAEVAQERDEAGRFVAAKQTHSLGLAAMAVDLDIPQDEIDRLPSDQLEDLIRYLNKQRFQLLQDRPAQSGFREQREPEEVPIDLGIPAEEEDRYDPTILKAMKKLAEENRSLKKEFVQIRESAKQREQQHIDEQIDEAFSGLTDHHAMLGAGALGALSPEELARRNAVLAVAQADTRGSIKQRIQRAVSILYPSSKAAAPAAKPANGEAYAEEELAKRRDQWERAPTARPTSREATPEPPGIRKAKKTFLSKVREMQDVSESANDEFPG